VPVLRHAWAIAGCAFHPLRYLCPMEIVGKSPVLRGNQAKFAGCRVKLAVGGPLPQNQAIDFIMLYDVGTVARRLQAD
jgi:hypothetical protein